MASYESFGRTQQKHRTRAALKAAAASLIDQGLSPSVAEVADAATISRSTAYRYFASAEILQAEVMLDTAIQGGLAAVYAAADRGTESGERLDQVVREDHRLVSTHEEAFRTALRGLIKVDTTQKPVVPRRPGNRLRYLAAALDPLGSQISPGGRERLVAALALCVGIESFIVTRDVCGLSATQAEDTKRWAANALLQQALRDELDGDRTVAAEPN